MRVLFLGGTRFIGLHAVRLLAERGHDVGVFHRGETNADLPDGVARLIGDRARLGESKETVRAFGAEVVVDMFAMTEAYARAAVAVFAGFAGRFVVASSADVYRARDRVWRVEGVPPDPMPLSEDAPLRTTRFPYRAEATGPDDWHYDYDKIPIEEMMTRELDATVLRLPAVYGPGDYRRRVWDYLQPIVDGARTIPIDAAHAEWRWTRDYVVNTGHAIALAATDARARGRIYNVGEEDALTERAWAESIARAAGFDGEVVPTPRDALPPTLAAEVAKLDFSQHWVADTQRIRSELGYRAIVPRDEAIRATVAWELAHRA